MFGLYRVILRVERIKVSVVSVYICDPLKRVGLWRYFSKDDVIGCCSIRKSVIPSCSVLQGPSSLPAKIVVFIQVYVKIIEIVMVRGSKVESTLIAISLINLKHSSMNFSPVNVVSSGINSQKEELFSADILLLEACSEVSTTGCPIHPNVLHNSV